MTLPAASRQIRAVTVSNACPLLPKIPNPCASCTVVATKIEWKATPAEARGQGKREIEAAKEDNANELRFDATGWTRGQGETISRPTLRPLDQNSSA